MKTLLKNGVVVDGSGSNRYQADVLIDGDKIVKIGKIDAADGAEVIDVTGLVVAPGFIDTHSHSDLQILVDPEVRPKVMQGITTEILGQDGISMLHCRKNISVLGERTWLVLMVTPIR